MITLTPITEVHAARIAERDATIAAQAAQIERLRSLLTRWSDYEDVGRIMGGIEAYERLAAETDAALSYTQAALQPKKGE